MHNIALTWQQAAAVSAALFAVALVLFQTGHHRAQVAYPLVREAGTLSALYALWQLAGTLSAIGTSGAFSRAHTIVRWERTLHLPSEARIQRGVLDHPLIVQACNLYYASMHFGLLFVFLLWLFLRHRDVYGRVRLTLALMTAACLLIQLIPVAPPRLLPGFIDTAEQYGQSVYTLGLGADQLSAMPSVHVGWAVLVGWTVVRTSSSTWRWLALLHPIATMYVITATANHFWLDGVVAVLVLVICAWLQVAGRKLGQRLARKRVEPTSHESLAPAI